MDGRRSGAEIHRLLSAVHWSTAAVEILEMRSHSLLLLTHTGIVYTCVCVCVGFDGGITVNPVWPRLNRTEVLPVTDKRQAPSAKSTWHQASFSLADAKSMTETLAGGQAGTPTPSSLTPQLLRPPLSESHCS